MKWFKLHHDIADDIKLRKFTPQEKWAWIAILCLASKSSTRGVVSAEDEDIADYCEFNSTQDWLYYRDKLISKGMIEFTGDGNLKITHWDERQHDKPSDHPKAVKERVRKHRAKKKEEACNALHDQCNASETPQIRIDQSRRDKEEIREDQIRDLETLPVDPIPACTDQNSPNSHEFDHTHEKSAFVCAELIESGQEKTASETPLTNVEVLISPTPEKAEPVAEGKSSEARRGKKVKIPNAEFEVFREAYNQDKPTCWAECQLLNEARIRALRKLHEQLGDRTLETFESALAFVRRDPWWGHKDMGFDQLLRDNRVIQFAERSQTGKVSEIDQKTISEYQRIMEAIGAA